MLEMSSGMEVYLRVCGGIPGRIDQGVCVSGLSPRVRRHPFRVGLGLIDEGSISACAEASTA